MVRAPFAEFEWTLPMAVAWIVWRKPEQVELAFHQKWLFLDIAIAAGIDLKKNARLARKSILKHLSSGRLLSRTSEGRAIPAIEWPNQHDLDDTGIKVYRQATIRLWPPAAASERQGPEQSYIVKAFLAEFPGGPPDGVQKQKQYDRVARRIKDGGGTPPTSKTIQRHLKKWTMGQ